jgi:photosystem II stability/assembly factor-like uncharacterized protein
VEKDITMNKKRILNLIARSGLFILILSLGTMAALAAGERAGAALPDVSGASVRAVAMAADAVVYASMTGGPQPTGIYRSDDNGRTWQVVSPGPGVAVSALAVDPRNKMMLYAGTGGGAADTTYSLWFSQNGGITWHKFPLGLPVTPEGMIPGVTALAVDPNRPQVLYVGTDDHGVYRFDVERDSYGYELIGGVSLYNVHVNGLVVGGDSRLYALTNDGLYATSGNTWQKLSPPEQAVVSLAVAPDDPQRLYAGGASTGVYRSTDGGQSWERMDNGIDMIPGVALRVTALTVDEQDPQRVLAAAAYGLGDRLTPGGVYESRDAGATWRKLTETDGVITQLSISQGVIHAATAKGLVRFEEAIQPAPDFLRHVPGLLSRPTGIQILILLLTAGLAGLALVGRTEWVSGKHAPAARS